MGGLGLGASVGRGGVRRFLPPVANGYRPRMVPRRQVRGGTLLLPSRLLYCEAKALFGCSLAATFAHELLNQQITCVYSIDTFAL
jgi:hypothetical protein